MDNHERAPELTMDGRGDGDAKGFEGTSEVADIKIIDDNACFQGAPDNDEDGILDPTGVVGGSGDEQTTALATESSLEGAGANFQTAYADVAAGESGDAEFASGEGEGAKTELQTVSEEVASALEEVVAALRAGEFPSLAPKTESELVSGKFDIEAAAGQTVAAENGVSLPNDTGCWSRKAHSRDIGQKAGTQPERSLQRIPGLEAYGVAAAGALRPLVRRWLNENMSRVVKATLSDEAQRTEVLNVSPPHPPLKVGSDRSRDDVGQGDLSDELACDRVRLLEEGTKTLSTSAERVNGAGPNSMVSKADEASQTLGEIAQWVSDPGNLVAAQNKLFKDYAELWDRSIRRFLGEEVDAVIDPEPDDNRLKDSD